MRFHGTSAQDLLTDIDVTWRSVSGDFRIRSERAAVQLTEEERRLASHVDFLLRSGLWMGDVEVLRVVQSLIATQSLELFRAGRREYDWHDLFRLEEMARQLTERLLDGRLRVEQRQVEAWGTFVPESPKLEAPPRPKQDTSSSFEVRLVDEVGQAIAGVPVWFDTSDGETLELSTNAAGVALLEPTDATSAKVRIEDVDGLKKTLEPRWSKVRNGSLPREGNQTKILFEEAPIGPVAIKAALPNTIVLMPPARLYVDVTDLDGGNDAEQELELQVRDQNGRVAAKYPRADAISNANHALRFELKAGSLPSSAQFVVRRGQLLERHGSAFDPDTLREELHGGRLAHAALCLSDAAHEDGRVAGPGAGTNQGAPTAAKSDLRLVIQFSNPKHRFLKHATVVVRGATLVPDSVQGRHVFDVDAGAKQVEFQVRIEPQAFGAVRDILLVRQTFEIFQDGQRRGMFERGTLHPRIRSIAFDNGKIGTRLIELDLRFLDVTDHARAVSPSFRLFAEKPTAGCNTIILEDTAPTGDKNAESAYTWAITVPPAVQKSSNYAANLFLFFQHEMTSHYVPATDTAEEVEAKTGPYTNSDNITYSQLIQYLAPPPPVDDLLPLAPLRPSYIFRKHTDLDPQRGRPSPDLPSVESLPNYPEYNWTHQLTESKKAVILAMPFPKGTDLGVLNRPMASHSELLLSLARALQAEKHVASTTYTPAFFQRLAVGGFSSGTATLAKWCAGLDSAGELAQLVKEVYFFDGRDDTRAALVAGGSVELWFKQGKDRKLRLIGTAYTERESILLAARLGNSTALDVVLDARSTASPSNVCALPGRFGYFHTSSYYQAAFSLPSPSVLLRFRQRDPKTGAPQIPTSPTPDMTARTRICIESERVATKLNEGGVTLSFDDRGLRHEQQLKFMSNVEAAALLHFQVMSFSPVGSSLSNGTDFLTVMKQLPQSRDEHEKVRILKLRHPWSVFGGAPRNGTFVGYLQYCLEESGF